jgi:uncharacterized membrane protein YidH (DUF202 family)
MAQWQSSVVVGLLTVANGKPRRMRVRRAMREGAKRTDSLRQSRWKQQDG